MVDLSKIAQEAISNLLEKKIQISPITLQEEFCKLIHVHGLEQSECNKFHKMIEDLGKSDEDFSLISVKNPYELSQKLIEKLKINQEIIAQNTKDISNLMGLIQSQMFNAISNNKKESDKIASIKNEMEQIELSGATKEQLEKFKLQLIDAADSFETSMNEVNENLEHSTDEVDALKLKVNALEFQLKLAEEVGQIDHLTGVLTRGAYEKAMISLESDFDRAGSKYAVIFIDIDYFKKINDNYGHDGGDFVLKNFGAILRKFTREHNIIGRYGGEEFVVGLKYNHEKEVLYFIKRIREVIESKELIYKGQKISLTFSAGISLRVHHESYQITVKEADDFVYQAKRNGRNRIVLSFEPYEIV